MTRFIFILAIVAVLAVVGPEFSEQLLTTGDHKSEEITARAYTGRRVVLKPERGGHFLTEARINNRAVKVLVDTGATVIALTAEDARKIGVRPKRGDYTYPVRTANGTAYAARIELKEVRIGAIKVRNVPALVSQPGSLGVTLLGMAFLKRLKSVAMADGQLVLVQ